MTRSTGPVLRKNYPGNKVPTLPNSVLNEHADATFRLVQPYRIVVRVGSGGTSVTDQPGPPACFFVTAIRELRADRSERVLILAANGTKRIVDSILDQLESASDSDRFTVHGGAEVREDGASATHLSDTLESASRVVWGDPASTLPRPSKRILPRGQYVFEGPRVRRAYEVVWTWCEQLVSNDATSNAQANCAWLPQQTTDFEVQARALTGRFRRRGPFSCIRNCSRSCPIAIRSSWSADHWFGASSIPSVRTKAQEGELLRGEWMHSNVCIGHSRPNISRGSDQFSILVRADPVTQQLMWPVPWPDIYAEYQMNFFRLDSQTKRHYLTALVNRTSSISPLSRCTWHGDETAVFLSMLTMDNLYHALLHAVPSREFFSRMRGELKRLKNVNLLPHFTQYWPGGPGQPRSINQSVGWRILVHSLGIDHSEWQSVQARAHMLTAPGGCNCYGRIFGGHSAFAAPPYMRGPALLRRVAEFERALAAAIGSGQLHRRILFQVRRNRVRQIVNEVELRLAIEQDQSLSTLVHFTSMESLPVVEQYRMVSSSLALAGVHGMGLAWCMLLPSAERGRTSCLEITGEWKQFSRLDYYSLSQANGVHYIRLVQNNSVNYGTRCTYRTCGNITATIPQVMEALRYMVHRFDADGRVGGCVVHPRLHGNRFGALNSVGAKCSPLSVVHQSMRM